MDIHDIIQSFLQQHSLIRLRKGEGESKITKAGVIPFLRDPYRYYLMKPIPRHARLGAPKFQIGKGTRMRFISGIGWKDMHEDNESGEKETLAVTALREGIEELGLVLENIRALFDMGPYCFASAKTGKEKHMWLFAAEMISAERFLPDREVAFTTAARGWLTLDEFAVAGREDHLYILQDIEERLSLRTRVEGA